MRRVKHPVPHGHKFSMPHGHKFPCKKKPEKSPVVIKCCSVFHYNAPVRESQDAEREKRGFLYILKGFKHLHMGAVFFQVLIFRLLIPLFEVELRRTALGAEDDFFAA